MILCLESSLDFEQNCPSREIVTGFLSGAVACSSISSNNSFASSIESLFKFVTCYFNLSQLALDLGLPRAIDSDVAILDSRLITRGPLLDFMFRVDSQISQSNSSLRPLRALREILFAPIRAFRGHGEERNKMFDPPRSA